MMIEQVLPGWTAQLAHVVGPDGNTPDQGVHDSDHEGFMTTPGSSMSERERCYLTQGR
jgi:hypothetical protein